jgi:hypothetical protein
MIFVNFRELGAIRLTMAQKQRCNVGSATLDVAKNGYSVGHCGNEVTGQEGEQSGHKQPKAMGTEQWTTWTAFSGLQNNLINQLLVFNSLRVSAWPYSE